LSEAEWSEPTRAAAAWFTGKRILLRLRHALRERWRGRPPFLPPSDALRTAPLLAEDRSPLWTDGRPEEFLLVAGKVHNLRRAAAAFDGRVLESGAVLSFWRQLGPPWAWRGFALGREVRSGCVIPTVGGGLCQLSNALLRVAQLVGMEVLERHAHSARIEAGSDSGPDATVAWNDIDLRLRSRQPLRLEVALSTDELVLRLRGAPAVAPTSAPARRVPIALRPAAVPVARGCLSCAQTECFRHSPERAGGVPQLAVLVDSWQPELAHWLRQQGMQLQGLEPWQWRSALRGRWPWAGVHWGVGIQVASLRAMLRLRRARGEGGQRQAALQARAQMLAQAYARRLQPLQTQLVVAQELLVPLWRLGVLGGRRFQVYMSQLPASALQAQLDLAAARHPEAASLRDFRADSAWLRDEQLALRAAQGLLSAHAGVVQHVRAAGLPVLQLDWLLPQEPSRAVCARSELTLVLAGSALARKGVHEVAEVARRLSARVLVLGSCAPDAELWRGVQVEPVGYGSDWLQRADAVLLPAWVEHAPRALLRALAAGVPVLASPACGLGELPGWRSVAPGDGKALEAALRASLPPEAWPAQFGS